MNTEVSHHLDIKFRVERMNSITSSISHLQSSNRTQGIQRFYPRIPAGDTDRGAGNWTVPTQEITALRHNLQEKHVFKFAVNARHI